MFYHILETFIFEAIDKFRNQYSAPHFDALDLPEIQDTDVPIREIAEALPTSKLEFSGSFELEPSEAIIRVHQDDEHTLVVVTKSGAKVLVISTSHNSKTCISEAVRTVIKKYGNSTEGNVYTHFWFKAGTSPVDYIRSIQCPNFSIINDNYTADIRKNVDWLLGLDKPWEVGKLIFWNGVPGTGKTYCIRALMNAWRDKFNFHIIMDPEVFFRDPSYLSRVMLEGNSTVGNIKKGSDKHKGNLVIIEDCSKTIMKESRVGQDSYDMSRLLNMTDGILGQGLSAVFLMTTNDDMTDVDPAFLRDGRCLQKLEFGEFSYEEANDWFKNHGKPEINVDESIPLSSMYAKLLNKKPSISSLDNEPVGFAPR